jgi:exonuclease V gamma subunit
MELIRSNRTEALADALAAQVREHPLDPLAQEVVVVQSRGMERWLQLALTKRLGIWANPCFPFPRALIERVLGKLDAAASEDTKAYDRARLKWAVAELLREDPPSELLGYLSTSDGDDRLLRLSTSVASVFDEYVIYRPDLLRKWANGEECSWQAVLWHRVVERLGPRDLASRIENGLVALRYFRSRRSPRSSFVFSKRSPRSCRRWCIHWSPRTSTSVTSHRGPSGRRPTPKSSMGTYF